MDEKIAIVDGFAEYLTHIAHLFWVPLCAIQVPILTSSDMPEW